ncbi:hypothetical protein AB0L40_10985 [Patulibacter sp. NPDC049589]|uniref:hypothetical protein n=1 Tax=Patulibacter sp. NPDC049589 TaxID=3154731 RepID=UPI003418054D
MLDRHEDRTAVSRRAARQAGPDRTTRLSARAPRLDDWADEGWPEGDERAGAQGLGRSPDDAPADEGVTRVSVPRPIEDDPDATTRLSARRVGPGAGAVGARDVPAPRRPTPPDPRPTAASAPARSGPRRPRPAAEAAAAGGSGAAQWHDRPGPERRSGDADPRRAPTSGTGGRGAPRTTLPPNETPGGVSDGAAGTPPAPRAHRGGVPVLLVLLLAAIGAGLLGWMGQTATAGTVRGSWEFSRLGGPWLVAGFVGGAIGGWRRGVGGLVLGIVAGAVMVGAGSVAYYGLSYWDGGNDARRAAKLGIGWGAAGVGVGGVLGLFGAAYATALGRRPSRDGGRVVGSWVHGAALGTLGGLLMGESIALLWVWDGGGLRAVATLEGLGGVAVVAVGAAARSWRFIVGAVLACAAAATVAPIATTALRETLRTIGWAGA